MARVVIDENGYKYYVNDFDRFHREDGPAVIRPSGEKWYYKNDVALRTDHPSGRKSCRGDIDNVATRNTWKSMFPDGFIRFTNDGKFTWPEL